MFIKWTTDIGGVKEMRNWKQPRMKVFGAGEAKSRNKKERKKGKARKRSKKFLFSKKL